MTSGPAKSVRPLSLIIYIIGFIALIIGIIVVGALVISFYQARQEIERALGSDNGNKEKER